MLFLRITPLVPNWFVNIASPIVGIDLKYFFIGTLLGINTKLKSRYHLGLMPANIIHVRAGLLLSSMTEVGLNLTVLIFVKYC